MKLETIAITEFQACTALTFVNWNMRILAIGYQNNTSAAIALLKNSYMTCDIST